MRRLLLAASALAVAAAGTGARAADNVITLLTGSTGSAYYPLGLALADAIAKQLPQTKAQVQATKGAVDNLNLLQARRGDVAFALGDALSDAWKGNKEAGFDTPLDALRGIAALYPNFVLLVARADSGVRTLGDVKGKRISVGARKSGIELDARALLAAAGMSYKDFAKVDYLPFGESVELMKNREIDMLLQSAALGASSLRDLSTSVAVVIVPVPADVVARMGVPYVPATVAADTFRGQASDVPTAAVRNYLVARDGVPVDTAYAVTKALWTSVDRLAAAHPAGKALDVAHALDAMPIPLHAGAEKYYREIGVIK